MSGGPVGKGMSYYATIRISKELTEKDLQDLVVDIKKLIGKHGGQIVDEARASTAGLPSFSVGFHKSQGR